MASVKMAAIRIQMTVPSADVRMVSEDGCAVATKMYQVQDDYWI